MGGRGMSVLPATVSPGYVEHWTNGLGQNITTLKAALGDKGKPMSMKAAFSGANPHFSDDFSEYSENCQRCVVAYELRRRGYDVTALPTYKGDVLPNGTAKGNGRWMGAFQNAKNVLVGAKTQKSAKANIESQMKKWGDGSRAIVRVGWKGTNYGHVFNVENRKGRMYFVDAQIGQRVNINEYLSQARTDTIRLVRTDNLRISDRAKKSVTTQKF